MNTPQTSTTPMPPQPDRDGLILDVHHQGQRIGSLHCINLARSSEPQRLGWFAKNAAGTATGAAWPTREEAAYDVFSWAEGKPGREKEVMYLPAAAALYERRTPENAALLKAAFLQWQDVDPERLYIRDVMILRGEDEEDGKYEVRQFQATVKGFTDWYSFEVDAAGNPLPTTIEKLPF
jgi:hypothetical protein